MMIELRCRSSADSNKTYGLQPGITTIGHDPSNHICLDDPQVASRQAEIVVWRNNGMLIDLTEAHSCNTTLVNGLPTPVQLLQDRDQIQWGASCFEFLQTHQEDSDSCETSSQNISPPFDQLLDASRLASTTINSMAHYLKNVLQSIHGGNRLIEDGLVSRDLSLIKRGWEIARRNQDNLTHYILDLVNFSTTDDPRIVNICLNQMVQQALHSVGHQVQQAGVRVWYDYAEDIPSLSLDPELVLVAIRNILLTAVYLCRLSQAVDLKIVTGTDDTNQLAKVEITSESRAPLAESRINDLELNRPSAEMEHLAFAIPVARKIIEIQGGELIAQTQTDRPYFRIAFSSTV